MLVATLKKSYQITKVVRAQDSLVLESEIGKLKISPQSADIVRVRYTEKGDNTNHLGIGVEQEYRFADWDYTEDGQTVTLILPHVQLQIDKQTQSITYLDLAGNLLLQEAEKEPRVLEYFDSCKNVIDENTVVEEVVTPDGVKKFIKEATKTFDKQLCHTWLNLQFAENEKIYGLGQAEEGTLNLRGTTQYVHQANLKIAIPFFLSSKGYGLLSATGGAAIFNDNAYGTYFYTDADEQMDFYFLYGPSFDEIIKGYRKLTGKAVMLPKWAFGFIQSQERYESQEEILAVAEEFHKRSIGLDCLVLDWCSWEEGHWGQKTFDQERFPDVPKMVETLREQHLHFMLSIWPNMNTITDNYQEFLEAGLLLPASEIYDAFDPNARALYWEQLDRGAFVKGVESFWCDSSEPFTPEWSRIVKPTPTDMYTTFVEECSQYIPREQINAYGLVHSQTIYEGQRGKTNDLRVCNLTRNSYTGGQKYGTIMWSGDTCASWETYRKQIVAGLNFCVTGLPYWTLDIGAFFVKKGEQWFWNGAYENTNQDNAYKELYTRWFQYAGFLPMFRAHGTDVRREIWQYGDEGDCFYDAMKAAIELRYQLLPYIYSQAAKVHFEDSTMLRMLAFDYRNDEIATEITDEFLFGESILVAPVVEPMYYGKELNPSKTRTVYLPKGNDWYDFYTGECYDGGQYITVQAGIETIPLFVKDGSIIPMVSSASNTYEVDNKEILYRVYGTARGEFQLYQDSGNGYQYESDEYIIKSVIWDGINLTVDGQIVVPSVVKK